jgi:argininosuccinate synthase
MMERIVLAYSGSEDDSETVSLLADEYRSEIVTLTLDVGQNQELEEVRDHSLAAGAARAHVLDVRAEFAHEFVLPALQAGALDDGREPIAFPLVHALIGKKLVEMAAIEKAPVVAHRGGGRDCIRIENSIRTLNPGLRVLSLGASAERVRTRTNLWGRAVDYETREEGPSEAVYSWTKSPETAPDTGAGLELGFERGMPTTVNGVPLDLTELIESVSIIAGRHGVGRVAPRNERGGRIRRLHEVPAAVVLHAAHAALETATGVYGETPLKQHIRRVYPERIVHGLWFTPLRSALDAFNAVIQSQVNGTVRLQLLKGNYTVAGVRVTDLESPTLERSLVVPQS